jgi:CreA protein
MNFRIAAALLALTVVNAASADVIGKVSTKFNLLTPNDKIVVEVFDDPRVNGVSCYLSHAKKGGLKGAVGVAEDTSDAAVACRQVGPISFSGKLPEQEEVFSERASLLFKRVQVVRMVDTHRNTLVYLVYSDRLIEGSPNNSVTAVPVPADLPIPLK